MRFLALSILVLAVVACSSSNATLPNRTQCQEEASRVWLAVQFAIRELGFRVIHSDPISRSIVGRIDAEIYGTTIEIEVSIVESKGGKMGNQPEPFWLQYQIRDVDNPDPDVYRLEQIEMMELRFLEILSERTSCGGKY